MHTLDKALLSVSRIGVFFVPFIPLIVTASLFFPFITGKGFAFRIITEIIFAGYLLLALRRPEFRPKRSSILFALLSFIAIVLLADIFAVNPFKAFWSNFERMEGFITMAHLLCYFLVAGAVLDTEKLWHRFFATSVGVSAFLGVYGLLQLGGKIVINQGGVRLDGTFGNAAYFAGYMLFHVFLSLFLIFRHRLNPGVKWLYGGAILLQVISLVFTATRGAALGLIGGLSVALLLIAVFERKNTSIRRGAAGIFIALVLLGLGFYAARDSAFVKNNPALTRFASVSVSDAGPRFMVWGMAWEGFKERPILGWGQEGFNHVFNEYYDPNMWAQEQWFDRTHNIFFDWLISAGAFGLLAYLSLFGFLLFFIWRGDKADGERDFSFSEKSALTGLIAAYVIHNFFVFDNLVSYILFFSLLAYVHMRFGKPFTRLQTAPSFRSEQASSVAGALLLVLLICSVYFLNIRPIRVALDLISALRPQEKGITENLSYYKQALARETLGAQEVAEQLMQAAVTVGNASNVSLPVKEEFVSLAVTGMTRELMRAPTDTRLLMFIGGFLNRLGRYAEALPYLEKAKATSPKKQTVAFELSNSYLSLGKTAEALALLRGAYEDAPKFPGAKTVYAVGAVYAREFGLADALLASTTDVSVLTDERLLKAYFDAKQYPRVISILKLRLAQNPNDPQTHISLAAVYIANGDRSKAIEELQKAIALNPDFKQQGEYYIGEIRAGRNP